MGESQSRRTNDRKMVDKKMVDRNMNDRNMEVMFLSSMFLSCIFVSEVAVQGESQVNQGARAARRSPLSAKPICPISMSMLEDFSNTARFKAFTGSILRGQL